MSGELRTCGNQSIIVALVLVLVRFGLTGGPTPLFWIWIHWHVNVLYFIFIWIGRPLDLEVIFNAGWSEVAVDSDSGSVVWIRCLEKGKEFKKAVFRFLFIVMWHVTTSADLHIVPHYQLNNHTKNRHLSFILYLSASHGPTKNVWTAWLDRLDSGTASLNRIWATVCVRVC